MELEDDILMAICGGVLVVLAIIFPKLIPKKKETVEKKKEEKQKEEEQKSAQSEIMKSIQDVSKTIDALNKDYNENEMNAVKEKVESIAKSIADNNSKKGSNWDMQKETQAVLNDALIRLRHDLDTTINHKHKANLDELKEQTEELTTMAEKAGFQTVKTKEGWSDDNTKKN